MPSAAGTLVSTVMDSPVGRLRITANERAVVALTWAEPGARLEPAPEPAPPVLARAVEQLGACFAGTRRDFDLPLEPPGGAFQKAVCQAMLRIPYGRTRTYGDLARDQGVAAQPIGQACGANPIAILIPCHRVVASDGKLGGFSGGRGAETKLALLRLEGAVLL